MGVKQDLDPIFDSDKVNTFAEPVRLTEMIKNPIKCNYGVVGGKTKYQLFVVNGRFGPEAEKLVRSVAESSFGDPKVEYIPELDSWYVEIPRAMADGGIRGAESLVDGIVKGCTGQV